ncbi:MAG: NAD(P)-dependent methylenetetrahydromethanopterin dehydrogenase [Pirellulaceae bacterium]
MDHPRILIQFDSDPHASVFDAVVAVDSNVDHLLQYSNVEPTNVQALVHGAMFTRGITHLHHTAIFVGGSNVALGEAIAQEIRQTFFGPIRVSVMLDGNGANTTAVAAVLCAARHVELSNMQAVVLGGTGPVGQRVARLLLAQGAGVDLVSRQLDRAEQACQDVLRKIDAAHAPRLKPIASIDGEALASSLGQCTAIFSCGAAGVTLLDEEQLAAASNARVAIDLNAVPPAGIVGIAATDKAVQRGERVDYGAIGVGGLKMKIHRESIATLFSRNDMFLDAEEILTIGQELEAASMV